MKPLFSVMLYLALLTGTAQAFAGDTLPAFTANCAVDQARQAESDAVAQDGDAKIVNCGSGQTFEIRQITPAGGKCSGSFWCGAFEHCVGGKCVPKDMFHGCDMFHTCAFGEKCVNHVCKR